MASIRLENLRKAFGPVVAVDTLSLEIPDGEFAALPGTLWLRKNHDDEHGRRP